MIDLEQYPLFAENKATLKQTSMDDSIKDEIQYMTESQMEVIDFDMVKNDIMRIAWDVRKNVQLR